MADTDDAPRPSDAQHAPPADKKPRAIVRSWRATRAIARDPAGTASLIALLCGAIISLPRSLGVGLNSIGYAIVGGAAFSFIYQYWANDALVRTLSSRVRRSQEKALREFAVQWNEAISETKTSLSSYANQLILLHRRHWPLEIYPEGNMPNPDFNRRIAADLERASRYDFRGQTGKHVAARLMGSVNQRLGVRMVIEDVTLADVMSARIDEKRFSVPDRFSETTDDEIEEMILEDLFDSLVGLYAARQRYDWIELVYASRSTDVRIEIIDGIVYMSPFAGNRPRGNSYPAVFRYDTTSIPAEVAALEYNREFGLLSGTKVRFERTTSLEYLIGHLRYKGWDLPEEAFRLRYRRAQNELNRLSTRLTRPPAEASGIGE